MPMHWLFILVLKSIFWDCIHCKNYWQYFEVKLNIRHCLRYYYYRFQFSMMLLVFSYQKEPSINIYKWCCVISVSVDKLKTVQKEWIKTHRAIAIQKEEKRRKRLKLQINGGFINVWPDEDIQVSKRSERGTDIWNYKSTQNFII